MNALWKSTLETAGAKFDGDLVTDFGDAAAERQAALAGPILAPLSHLGLIAVAGEDAQSFLHNQVTSDVNHLKAETAQHSAWCTAKGRMLASFLLWKEGDAYQIRLAAEFQPAIQKRLQMYVLRAKVQIASRSDAAALIGLAGAGSAKLLADLGLPVPEKVLDAADAPAGKVIRLEGSERFQLVLQGEAAPALWQALSAKARPVGTPVWQWLDIQAGIPLITGPTQEAFVPQMANFERIGGVSFHKGCYPGQEVVARTQYLGKVKRSLYRARVAAPVKAGDPLFSSLADENHGGAVVNAAPALDGQWELLAVIPENCASGGPVSVGALGGPALELLPLPYQS
ncbi:MAG TPA: folate-binding protein [Azospira sp.]|nr:folate-binding protein [Azospira sp.]